MHFSFSRTFITIADRKAEENTFQMVYFFFFFWWAVWSDPLEGGGESTEMETFSYDNCFVGGRGYLNPRLSLYGRKCVLICSSKKVFKRLFGIREGYICRGWQLKFEKLVLPCLNFFRKQKGYLLDTVREKSQRFFVLIIGFWRL